jgi:hypothetical protein
MDKKYELVLDDTIIHNGVVLCRIKALKDFGNIATGTLGGYIEKEDNLSHEGDAWVFSNARVFENAQVAGKAWVSGNAQVFGNARVFENAQVSGKAWVSGNAQVFGKAWVSGNAQVSGGGLIKEIADYIAIQGIGSRDGVTTFFRTESGIGVACGCFSGTIDEFGEAVEKTHGDNKHGKDYRSAIILAKLRLNG